jgi:orotidine-5'-phosphate decarboxylase
MIQPGVGPLILATDNMRHEKIINLVADVLSSPEGKYVSYIKLNDVVHDEFGNGPQLVRRLRSCIAKCNSTAGIFLDFKLADTKGSNVNIFSHYAINSVNDPEIVTIRDNCSIGTFVDFRKKFTHTKIALVSALTDMPVDECERRYGAPVRKIKRDIDSLHWEYGLVRRMDDYANLPCQAFDMIVCSPQEVKEISSVYAKNLKCIVPGIRDDWMLKGQQARASGLKNALEMGADFCVLGAQMTVGNPKEGVSAEESRRRTAEIIVSMQANK